MKKTLLTFLVAVVTVCACAFCLVACGSTQPYIPPEPEIGPTPISVSTVIGTDYIGVYDCEYEDGRYDSEFKLDDGEWIESDTSGLPEIVDGRYCSAVWRNLTPGGTYTLYARFKTQENGAVVSGESFTTQITLKKLASDEKPEVTVAMTDGKTIKINGFTQNMEASFTLINPEEESSGSDGYIDKDTFTFKENGRITVKVRFKETATTEYKSDTVIYAYATDFGGGTGEQNDPFLIKTYAQLVAMGEADGSYMPRYAYFRLENDIACPENHKPLNEVTSYYLDGNGKKLTGVNITADSGSADIGVFKELTAVENLTVEDAKIKTVYAGNEYDNTYTGIIAGNIKGYARNCKVSGVIEISVNAEGEDFAEKLDPAYIYTGGLAGSVWGDITGCSAEVKIILPNAVTRKFSYYPACGGLAGGSTGVISLSYSVISLLGANDLPAVSNGGKFGGLAGEGSYGEKIENSYSSFRLRVNFATPNPRADLNPSYIGGLIGSINNAAVKNSYATGRFTVEAEESFFWQNAGGLIGKSAASLENCFANINFNITATNPKIDALSASFESEATVTNCYFVDETTAAESGATQVEDITLRDKEWQIANLGFGEELWVYHDYHFESEKFYPTHK